MPHGEGQAGRRETVENARTTYRFLVLFLNVAARVAFSGAHASASKFIAMKP